jgi:hypothetical protein
MAQRRQEVLKHVVVTIKLAILEDYRILFAYGMLILRITSNKRFNSAYTNIRMGITIQ